MANKISYKSDSDAKSAFMRNLENRGYTDVKPAKVPSDIKAKKDGVQWYFEIKKTSKTDQYFGAATLTEWEQAFKTPDTYRFVIAIANDKVVNGFEFIELTPAQMMEYSTIPPFKIFFNLDLNVIKGKITNKKKNSNRKNTAIRLTVKTFSILRDSFCNLRKNSM